MTKREEILKRLKELLLSADEDKEEAVARCTEETTLTGDLGLNSVGMLFMVIAMEEDLGIRFDDIGMSDFRTIGDVVDYVEKALARKDA